ncbi:3-oxoadipate enol-lactone hydrolase-like protein [Pseudomassariella vexata]|uniref:3-oxoadipate enol-lactone hydrolase-like protein n=1 Tax=Pseudomassariella vexata TaxID=1141098 RepID=A0A1Y2DTI8_9PEZI|nr:3-oxoadipate enol-lactone hydrolase-like protein [Pseudomassariella vexata]ORY62456.1 3-oxoadipate enol-lactone hydrolase-like protein [Pseudomassariella vexata]
MPFFQAAEGKRFFYTHRQADHAKDGQLTILMIHGLGSTHAFYGPILPTLVDAGFAYVAYDTHGSGLSSFSGKGQDVKSMTQDALSLMEQLHLVPERTVLVGHSMGGMVACELASRKSMAGLVLLGPVHPNPGVAGIFSKRIEVVKQEGMEAMADTIPRAATGSQSTAAQHAMIRSLLLSQDVLGYASLCEVIAKASPPDYDRVKCPVLILAGGEDKSAPLDGCRIILEQCGTVRGKKRLQIVDGVGHWHCIESPGVMGEAIAGFATQVSQLAA